MGAGSGHHALSYAQMQPQAQASSGAWGRSPTDLRGFVKTGVSVGTLDETKSIVPNPTQVEMDNIKKGREQQNKDMSEMKRAPNPQANSPVFVPKYNVGTGNQKDSSYSLPVGAAVNQSGNKFYLGT
jgi:hypothetical protein